MVRLLSHPLSAATPTYPGTPGLTIEPASRIERGDVANWIVVTTQNHIATHVDGPWHFNPHGKRITELAPAEFAFSRPVVVDIPKGDDGIVTGADLAAHATEIDGADLLLVRTGFGAAVRAADPARYSAHSPGFDSTAGRFLVDHHPSLRAIAIDFLSCACPAYAEEGQEFHRICLGRRASDRYILLIEDARIDADLEAADLGFVVMAPLLIEDQDGGPVTMLAFPEAWGRTPAG